MITEERRYDRGSLQTPRWHGNVLLAQGYAARPGVYEYRNVDGTITRELIRPETLVRSVAGLARCPVTLDHPDEDVTSANHDSLNVGDVDGEVEIQDDGYVRVKIAVRRKDAQQAVTNGTQRELSPGYVAKIDKTPGRHPEYGDYDAEQVDRTYNHLAIVKDARGGPRIAIRTDASWAEAVHTLRGDTARQQESKTMINQKLLDACVRAGIDVRRIDSDDVAVQLLEARWAQRGRRRWDTRRGRRDMDPAAPPMDPSMIYPDSDEPPFDPNAVGDEGEDPNVYKDEEGNPVVGESGAPMTKDEVIEALRNENEQLMAQVGETANDEEVENLAPLAEDEDIDPAAEEFKTDGLYGRRTDALKLAVAIVEKVRGEKLDLRRVTHDQLDGYISSIRDQKRRDGRVGAGRAAGRAAWDSGPRQDAAVIRLDSYGPSDIWSEQQARALAARRNGGR